MKQLIKLGFIFGSFVSNSIFAADPVQGFYFGLLAGLSYTPNLQLSLTLDQQTYNNSQITHQLIGGGGGFSIGYKIERVRLEGEFLFNYNSYNELKIGSCTLISPNVVGPQGVCPAYIEDNGIGFKGNTMGFYGLFNVFFDFLSSDPNVNLVPYIGAGVGIGSIQNTAQLQNNVIIFNGYVPFYTSVSGSNTNPAVQGIIGLNYYLDDYTTIGVDFRYLSTFNFSSTTSSSSSFSNSAFGISTLNLTANFALEKGGP